MRDNGQIRKLAEYVILTVSMTGHKEVLSIHIGENESAKYWLGVLNELKNRGVKDILTLRKAETFAEDNAARLPTHLLHQYVKAGYESQNAAIHNGPCRRGGNCEPQQ